MNTKNSPLCELLFEIGCSLGIFIMLMLIAPTLSVNPNFGWELFENLLNGVMSEFFTQFVGTLCFLELIFCIPIALFVIGYFVVWLIYRLSLSRIYSKPRRVYPVEKQKFFSG